MNKSDFLTQCAECGIKVSKEALEDALKEYSISTQKHGYWISYLDGEHIIPERYYQCSECGRRGYTKMHPYCNCGAKMDAR